MSPALVNRSPLVQEDAGQPLALSEVYRRHARQVGRWAARLGGPAIDVEDVVQEVFLAAHRKLAGFRGEASLTTWLYRITENVVRHRRRKDRWRRWLGGTADEVAAEVPSPGPTPIEAVAARQANERVYRVLDGMKEKYRTVLILFELEEHSGEEVASLTGAKIGTVWVWLHRARADFAKRLDALDAKESS
ncbi:MAG: RNA polymerase sigma factor [Myxococcaceae bacterium]